MTLSNNQVHELLEYLNAREREREELAYAASETQTRHSLTAGGDWSKPVGKYWEANDGMVYGLVGNPDNPTWLNLWDDEGSATLCMRPEPAKYIAAHDPAWTFDDVYVKSYLLAMFARMLDTSSATKVRTMVIKTLQVMSRPYRDRDDFKAEWTYHPSLPETDK